MRQSFVFRKLDQLHQSRTADAAALLAGLLQTVQIRSLRDVCKVYRHVSAHVAQSSRSGVDTSGLTPGRVVSYVPIFSGVNGSG